LGYYSLERAGRPMKREVRQVSEDGTRGWWAEAIASRWGGGDATEFALAALGNMKARSK